MHASIRRVGLTYAILAAVFGVTALSVFALLAWLAPAKAPPRSGFAFTAAAPAPTATHRRRVTHLEPNESAEIEKQLTSVSVSCRVAGAFPIGEPGEITLTLELGQRGPAADLHNPQPCSSEPQTLRVAGNVSALLRGPPDVMKFAPAEEKQYAVTPAAPINWTWYVTPLRRGTFDAQIVLSTELTIGGKAEPIQIWTPAQKVAVDLGFFDWINYVIDWISSKPFVSGLVGGLLATLGAAIVGTMRGWFAFLFRRKPKQDAQAAA
jgi:hypothetical protein